MSGDRGLREMRLSDLFIVKWWQRSRLKFNTLAYMAFLQGSRVGVGGRWTTKKSM